MNRREITEGARLAFSNNPRKEALGSRRMIPVTVVDPGPVERRAVIYEHPFSKIVMDGVLVRLDSGDEVVVSPREILGTWQAHEEAQGIVKRAEEVHKQPAPALERNTVLLGMFVERDRNFDFATVRNWLAGRGDLTPKDLFLLLNSIYGYRVFDDM